MKRTLAALTLLALASLGTTPALAGIDGGEVSVSPFAGGYVFDGSQHLSSGLAMGARLGYHLTPNWGAEGQFTYARPSSHGNYGNLYALRADALYHFMPKSDLVPFLALGGGWMRTEAPHSASDDATLDVGAGLKYFINDSVALRGDFRQVMAFKSGHGTDTWQNSEITAGLTFHFGRVKATPPPVVQTAETPPPPVAPAPEASQVPRTSWSAETDAAPSGKIIITGLRAEENALEIQANERIRNYSVFTLTQPSRLVIDINNAVSGFSKTSILIDKVGLATLGFESYPDYLRIFLNAGQGRILPYRVQEGEKSLKIIMTPYNVPPSDKKP
jgi:outer membrane beta-barrel protein